MKTWKKAFWLSLIVNIVLAYWTFRQHGELGKVERGLEKVSTLVNPEYEELHGNLDELRRKANERHLRHIARMDQLDAFLEERGIHVE